MHYGVPLCQNATFIKGQQCLPNTSFQVQYCVNCDLSYQRYLANVASTCMNNALFVTSPLDANMQWPLLFDPCELAKTPHPACNNAIFCKHRFQHDETMRCLLNAYFQVRYLRHSVTNFHAIFSKHHLHLQTLLS